MAWYDIDNKTDDQETKREYLAMVQYQEILANKVDTFEKVFNPGALANNVQLRLVTTNSFNAIVVLKYLIKYYEIVEMYIAIYRMNQVAVNYLKQVITEKNIPTGIILSQFFRENKNYERWANDLITFADNHKHVRVTFANNHAKVFLAKTNDGKHIVFEGSGNLSDNARIEQYIIEDNKTTYNFHKEWIIETLM